MISTESALQVPFRCPSPERLLARVRRVNHEYNLGFYDSDIPTEIPELEQQSLTEILTLAIDLPKKGRVSAVERTFTELARIAGLSYWNNLGIDFQHLKLVVERKPGIRWIMFDYAANLQAEGRVGRRVIDLQRAGDSYSLVASEGLSQLALIPELVASIGITSPCPNLAGYQYYNYQKALYVRRKFGDIHNRLYVDQGWAEDCHHKRSSPRFRECKI